VHHSYGGGFAQAPHHGGYAVAPSYRPHVGGIAPTYGRSSGYGYGYGGRGFGYGVGFAGLGGYGYPGGYGYGYRGVYGCGGVNRGYGYASTGTYLTDPVTGFVYYCPYGLAGWAGWGSGLLPYGAYRIA
jgi:hypothetical protein